MEDDIEHAVRPAEVDERKDGADEERRDGGPLGEARDRRAPLRVGEAQDRRGDRAAVADADEEDQVADVEAPGDPSGSGP